LQRKRLLHCGEPVGLAPELNPLATVVRVKLRLSIELLIVPDDVTAVSLSSSLK
jgi:hypothetical protein